MAEVQRATRVPTMWKPVPALNGFVILSEVMLAMVYLAMLSIWSLWRLCTFEFAPLGEVQPPFVSTTQFALVSACNGVLVVLFMLAARRARKSSPAMRRGHWAGLVLATVGIGLAQYGVMLAQSQIGS